MNQASSNPYASPSREGPLSEWTDLGEIVLSGILTIAEARMANRMAKLQDRLRLVTVTLFVGLFWLFLIAFAVSARPEAAFASSIILLVALVIFPVLPLAVMVIDSYRLAVAARERIGMFTPTRWVFSSSKIIATTAAGGTELTWEMFSLCLANEDIALLFGKNKRNYLVLLRRHLAPEARWDHLLELIHTQLAIRGKLGVVRTSIPDSIWSGLINSAWDREGKIEMLLDRDSDPAAFQIVNATPDEVRWTLGVICDAFAIPLSQLYCLRPHDDLREIYAAQTRYSWGDDLQFERLALALDQELGEFRWDAWPKEVPITVQALTEWVARNRKKTIPIAELDVKNRSEESSM